MQTEVAIQADIHRVVLSLLLSEERPIGDEHMRKFGRVVSREWVLRLLQAWAEDVLDIGSGATVVISGAIGLGSEHLRRLGNRGEQMVLDSSVAALVQALTERLGFKGE